MMALILAEITNWNLGLGRRTLSILVCCSTLAGFVISFNPEIYFWGMLIVFVWIGSSLGEQGGANIDLGTRNRMARLSRLQVIFGEIAAAGILAFIHILALLPVAVLLALLWGVPWTIISGAGLKFMAASVITASFRILIRRLVRGGGSGQ